MRYRALSRDERSGGAGSFRRKFIEKLAAAGAVEPLARAGNIGAETLAVAATYGPLPPCVIAVETRHDGGDAEAAALFGSRSAFDFLWASISGAHLCLLT
jgi:hypothetical protein